MLKYRPFVTYVLHIYNEGLRDWMRQRGST